MEFVSKMFITVVAYFLFSCSAGDEYSKTENRKGTAVFNTA